MHGCFAEELCDERSGTAPAGDGAAAGANEDADADENEDDDEHDHANHMPFYATSANTNLNFTRLAIR